MSVALRSPATRNVADPFVRRTGVGSGEPVGGAIDPVGTGERLGAGLGEGVAEGGAPELHPASASAAMIAAAIVPRSRCVTIANLSPTSSDIVAG